VSVPRDFAAAVVTVNVKNIKTARMIGVMVTVTTVYLLGIVGKFELARADSLTETQKQKLMG
jgi:hypothetical protein